MQIMSLIGKDTFIEAVVYNCTDEWIEEIVFTHNVFKARDIHGLTPVELTEIADYIREHENTLIEIKEVL